MAMDACTDRDLLLDARARARKLVDEMRRQQADLAAGPRRLTSQQMATGEAAMRDAVAAAERMLAGIEAALAADPPAPTSPPRPL